MLSKQQPITTPPNTELPLSQTNPEAAKQQSAAQKLELLGAIKGMQEGVLLQNDQLDSLLERLINNRVIRSREHGMSQDGKNLLNDFRALMESLRKTLQVKNKDQLFQAFTYHLHCMDIPVSKEQLDNSVGESEKNAVKQEGKKASQALYNIGKLILLNNEFRTLLGELLDIGQNIFSSLTDQAGEDLKKTGDAMKDKMNLNESGKEKVDDIAFGDQSVHEPHLIDENATDPTHAGLLDTGDSVHPDILPTNPTHLDRMSQQNNLSGANSSQFQPTPLLLDRPNKMDQYKNAMHNQGQEHKETIMKHVENRKQKVNQTTQENFDEEQQTDLLDRLQNAIGQVQRHPKYQEAIETLIGLVKTWSNRLDHARGKVKEHIQSQDSTEQASYRDQAEMELKTLIEGWAQGRSIDPILESVQTVMNDAKNDPTLRQYYDTALQYVQRLLRDPDYINNENSTEDGQQLIDIGRELMKGKYGEHYQYLSNQVRDYMHLLAEDDISREINDRVTQIHQDLWMDSEGNPVFKPHLVNDMRKTLLPAFLDEIKFIPVPRIEFSDKQFDVVVENVIISGETLIPNFFDVKAESFASFNFKSDQDTSSSHQSLLIHMSEIQADINDVLFSYSKKSGFPKIKDQGVASLAIDKKGISIVTRVQSTNNPAKTFKVTYCKCHVDHIKVKVNDSKHDILYKVVLPLVMGTVRKQIARAIEMKIVESLNTLDQKVTMSLVNVNQKAQNKAYDALPESEKANVQPEQLSQARPRPGLFSTLVTVMNRNIQAKTEKRNMEKKNKKSSKSSGASMETDRHHALPDAAPSTPDSSFRQPPSSSQLKNHPNSALASGTLNEEYTDLSQNIPNRAIGSNKLTSGNPSESPAASMKTDRYHALSDAASSTANSSFRQPPSSSQLRSHPDSALASSTLNNEYTDLSQSIPSATLSSNQPISVDSNYPQQSSNDQIDISKIPHPSTSTFNNPNSSLPSDTGTHNTPLSHGHTIDQESKAARMGIQDKQRDETNHLMSSYSQPIPKHDPSFDINNDPVNSNGIDNQHFKLAMELGEAQNPNLPGQQTRGQMEGARQL